MHLNSAESKRLADLHELPTAEQAGMDPARVSERPLVARRSRGITRYRIVESIHSTTAPRGKALPGLVWIPLEDLASISLSGPHRRWTTQILSARKA